MVIPRKGSLISTLIAIVALIILFSSPRAFSRIILTGVHLFLKFVELFVNFIQHATKIFY